VARIEDAANELVGRYNITEHNAYQGLRHGRLNHIFELAGILCRPRPERIMRKHKSTATETTSAPMLEFDGRELSNSNGKGKRHSTKENDMENNVNSCQSNLPPLGVPVQVYL
jgi:hypothetical protein